MKWYWCFVTCLIIITGCKQRTGRLINTSTPATSTENRIESDSVSSCNCFEESFPNYGLYGRTIIRTTSAGNFLKYTAINDSQFIFSCGREQKEIVMDTGSCATPYRHITATPAELIYDNDDIIVIYNRLGSNSWDYAFVSLLDNKAYHSEALYIDTVNLRYVDLLETGKDVCFVVHNLLDHTEDTVVSHYYKFRQGGYPLFFISDVIISQDRLFYSVECNDASTRKDTLIF